ncbi:MAG: hypothetical protein LW650_02720 [Planctomycetaceae bacterium]|jgi:predicted transcriptional regulator of viral defense system|nr:hypothetical protein [Phycisphaerales bacterium]MCE2652437.1 hypothetical protein [Planctomycetaceae bacterium]
MTYRDQKDALRSLTALAVTQGGYFTAKQAGVAGYGTAHLAYHVSAGNFERSGRGLYRIATLPTSEHDDLVRLWLWTRDRNDRPQGTVSHQTALSLHDLGELIPGEIHLTVPRVFRKRAPKGCRLHKGKVEAGDSKEMFGFRVTTPLRTLQDLAADGSLSREQLMVAVSAATERGLIRREQGAGLLRAREAGAGRKLPTEAK